ncbi:MAG: TonB-dependent receptor [Rhizomicrobium sp.]|jgi:outer membrane receptor protein involved in Fe transport
MSAQRPGTGRSSLFVTALLLSTAIAAPALAQVEQVVVTAQRKSENVQNVPIAITAFSSQDIQAHQIQMAKDLQFATPNVTYTKTNFSGDDFSIRGIGNDVITGGGESGVAVSFDNIYIAGASLALSSVYDIGNIEILEGPQSILYGRGATAGAINIIPNKPDLEQASVTADFSYGNYDSNEDRIAVNLPLVDDQLGLRISADREYNSGIITNEYNDSHIDGNDTYSIRGMLRWQPTENTTIDFIAQTFHKDDSTMRAQRQQCLWDPSGTLGCLPNGLANQNINENAFFSADLASTQAFADEGLPSQLGLVNLQQQAALIANPTQAWHLNTDFQPTWRADDDFLATNIKQKVTSWLDFEANIGYDHGDTVSQESYNNGVNTPINQAMLGTYGPGVFGSSAETTLYDLLASGFGACPPADPLCNAAYANLFDPYLASHPGYLPAAGFSGLGLSTDNVKYWTNTFSTYDQSNAEQQQYSIDLRFRSDFQGPFNFLVGGLYVRQDAWGDYYVSSGAQGYASVALGSIIGAGSPACQATGCLLDPAYYDNSSPAPGGVTLKSQSVYGEVYYQFVPDLLKLTLGARWTDDFKSQEDRILLINSVLPIGTTSFPTNPAVGGVPYQYQSGSYQKITGRAVLSYTPKLDFTDQTQFYASYSRGYKAGGFNPGLTAYAVSQGVQSTYQPEGIDAFEVGSKNILLNATLQANLDAWYYNYEGLQISQILDNDSINANVNSRMYGSEGQLVYAPDEHWAFNFNVGFVHSALGNTELVDPRNPTAGAKNAVLIKDATPTGTAAQNCAVYLLPGQTLAPGDNAALAAAFAGAGVADPYFDPPGGSAQLAGAGIPLTNYGTCNPAFFQNPGVEAIMAANGYSFTQPGGNGTPAGVPEQLKGNENPNTPPVTLSFGVQYTFNVGSDYTLVPRVDLYWQSDMWGRVFEDPADKVQGYEITNAQIQLNSPDNVWYVQGYMKNVFNTVAVTGEYLTSSSSGLYTNQFLQDPRMYGVRVGVHF